MPWPIQTDYNEAIQNPLLCFNDPELRLGKPDEDMLGLPRPMSGNFATVYRMRCDQHDFAVKCFTRNITDQRERYAEISQHLSHERLPYMVPFDFLTQGIKVRGQPYPILKMGWISGDGLHIYIKKHLNDPSKLFELARRWLVLVKSLKEASIAHGDLQHGNVLVANGDLKIVDYDGMFVPSLQGKTSDEIGHANYQHPQRTASDFGPELDHFSAWSIYTSIVALSVDPSLWSTITGAGEDCLLFRKEDYVAPQSSSTLSCLTTHSDPRIQVLSSLFASMMYLSPQQVPPLDSNAPQPSILPSPTTSSAPAWLDDYVSLTQTSTVPTQPQAKIETSSGLPAGSASWVLDFIDPPQLATSRSFDSSFAIPRVIAIVALLAIPGLSIFALPVHIVSVIGLLLFDQLVLLVNYRRTAVAVEKRSILTRQQTESREMDSIKKMMRENDKISLDYS